MRHDSSLIRRELQTVGQGGGGECRAIGRPELGNHLEEHVGFRGAANRLEQHVTQKESEVERWVTEMPRLKIDEGDMRCRMCVVDDQDVFGTEVRQDEADLRRQRFVNQPDNRFALFC